MSTLTYTDCVPSEYVDGITNLCIGSLADVEDGESAVYPLTLDDAIRLRNQLVLAIQAVYDRQDAEAQP